MSRRPILSMVRRARPIVALVDRWTVVKHFLVILELLEFVLVFLRHRLRDVLGGARVVAVCLLVLGGWIVVG